jgi:hypothetical protein
MSSIDHGEQFLKSYSSLSQVLTDKPLAALGDAYVNFVYSLALSRRTGKPCGKKAKGTPLAEAVRKAELRKLLPSRIDKHVISDAGEAFLVYSWLNRLITLEESVEALEKAEDLESGLTKLLLRAKEKTRI